MSRDNDKKPEAAIDNQVTETAPAPEQIGTPQEQEDLHSFDLSFVASRMPLPSRDLYNGDMSRLLQKPTVH